MDELWKVALALLYGYLLGSVSLAYLVGRLVKGIDLRRVGTGTLGASNVWHHVGKGWIFPVGIFDLFVKGATPVVLARFGLGLGLDAQAGAGLLAVAGHNWPIFLWFKGGRGVTPMVGLLLVMPTVGLSTAGLHRFPTELALFIIVSVAGWRLAKSSALWVLISAMLLPVWSLLLDRPTAFMWLIGALLVLLVVKRLTSNFAPQAGVGLRRLLWTRLLFDRDIADHDAWVSGGAASPSQGNDR